MLSSAQVGTLIAGKYRVERVLGKGGMGIVVAARHLQLDERVAIKFPLARMRDRGDVVTRLVREGRASMRIRSEHVARVYDIGVLEGGEPYLVMEYLVGRDLGAMLADTGPLAIGDAVEYILQSLEALAEAHAYGIVHRDLKPSNLFLTRRADRSPLVKLIDFGISKFAKIGGETTLTDTAAVLGSGPYMAPEQMRSGRDSDPRSDIWAIGATLHALLVGVPPFLAGSMVEIHERMLSGPQPLRIRRPDAPAALETILLRCMQKEPANRYADVSALAQALAEVAPPHARISAQRAAGILSSAPPAPDDPDEGSQSDASVAGGSALTASRRAMNTALPIEASWHEMEAPPGDSSAPGNRERAGTNAARRWRRAQAPRAGWFGLGAITIGTAAVIFVGVRKRETPSTPAPIAAVRAMPAISRNPPISPRRSIADTRTATRPETELPLPTMPLQLPGSPPVSASPHVRAALRAPAGKGSIHARSALAVASAPPAPSTRAEVPMRSTPPAGPLPSVGVTPSSRPRGPLADPD